MEKCRGKTEIIKAISDQSTKLSEITRKGADEDNADSPFLTHRLSCLSGCFLLLLPASPVTSHRRSEGIPVAGQKWQVFLRLQHNWSALCTWPGENQHECMCARAHTQTYKTRLLERESVASSQPVCRPQHQECLPAAVITVERSRKLNWCDSLHPLQFSLTSPFLHCLKELISRFLRNTHPHPLLRASSRVWRSYTNTCASQLSTSSCCSSVLSFCNKPPHKTGHIAVAEQWSGSCTSVWGASAQTNPQNLTECTSTVSVMHPDVTRLTSHVNAKS